MYLWDNRIVELGEFGKEYKFLLKYKILKDLKLIITLEKPSNWYVSSYHGFNKFILHFSLIHGCDFPMVINKIQISKILICDLKYFSYETIVFTTTINYKFALILLGSFSKNQKQQSNL